MSGVTKRLDLLTCIAMALSCFWLGNHVGQSRAKTEVKACIQTMFTNDAFAPGDFIEIRAGQAPPHPDAVYWINRNVDLCLDGTFEREGLER